MSSFDFPFRWADQEPAKAEGSDSVNASINHILSTDQGERIGRPDFGVDVVDLVFRNIPSLATADIRRQYTLAINRYEKRADVLRVPVSLIDLDNEVGLQPQIIWRYKGKTFKTVRKITSDTV